MKDRKSVYGSPLLQPVGLKEEAGAGSVPLNPSTPETQFGDRNVEVNNLVLSRVGIQHD